MIEKNKISLEGLLEKKRSAEKILDEMHNDIDFFSSGDRNFWHGYIKALNDVIDILE